MRALVVIAHGSRSEAANEEFCRLVGALASATPGYARVAHAFLEAAAPSLPAAMAQLVVDGCREADIYPLFFNGGRHVARDLPALLEEVRSAHPDCRLRLLPHFGAWSGLAQALAAHIAESGGD